MKLYEFGLHHDKGEVVLRISDDNIESAKRRILELEKAPASAITWWRVVPTEKQIKRTKSLLRGI